MGERLDEAMKEQGWTPAELSRKSGVSAPSLTKFLNGTRGERISADQIAKLASALSVEIRWLLDGTGEKNVRQTSGRAALDRVLPTMSWPLPISIEAADAATIAARLEADGAGKERVESVWVHRLLQLYAQALDMPASLKAPPILDEPSSEPPPAVVRNGTAPTRPSRPRRR